MQFYVEGYLSSHNIPEQDMDIYPHVKLVTDVFDDFGNQTLFRMYYRKKKISNYEFIGKIKILNSYDYVVRKVIPSNFQTLKSEYCSLGQSVEYYRRLKELNEKSNPPAMLGRME